VPDEAAASVQRLRAFNEMCIISTRELMYLLSGSASGLADGDLLVALEHWATLGGCAHDLDWALGKALGDSAPQRSL